MDVDDRLSRQTLFFNLYVKANILLIERVSNFRNSKVEK
jgi:hypothetical protein